MRSRLVTAGPEATSARTFDAEPFVMQPDRCVCRAQRVLQLVDQAGAPLCVHHEAVLIAAASGRPVPVVIDESGAMVTGEDYADALLALLETRLSRRVPA